MEEFQAGEQYTLAETTESGLCEHCMGVVDRLRMFFERGARRPERLPPPKTPPPALQALPVPVAAHELQARRRPRPSPRPNVAIQDALDARTIEEMDLEGADASVGRRGRRRDGSSRGSATADLGSRRSTRSRTSRARAALSRGCAASARRRSAPSARPRDLRDPREGPPPPSPSARSSRSTCGAAASCATTTLRRRRARSRSRTSTI